MVAVSGGAAPSAPAPSAPAPSATLGVLVLDTRFPRIPGDAGHAATWPVPVLLKTVRGATAKRVVKEGAVGLLPDFIDAGRELVASGADVVTTTCGFLSPFQAALSEALGAPTLTSSLTQVAWMNAVLPKGRRAGVLTIDAAALSPDVLAAAGAPADTPVVGLSPASELARVIFFDDSRINVAAAERDMAAAARTLAAQPGVGSIVLECANMPPYAACVRAAAGVPVVSVYDAVLWLLQSAAPRRWPGSG